MKRVFYCIITCSLTFLSLACDTQDNHPSAKAHNLIEMVNASPDAKFKPSNPSGKYGQLLYVPVYSEIYSYSHKRTVRLSATLSIHNTDPEYGFHITRVEYYSTNGKMLRRNKQATIYVQPLEAKNYVLEYEDTEGGVGANFLIEWQADKAISPPLVETVMINLESNWGLSFTAAARVVRNYQP